MANNLTIQKRKRNANWDRTEKNLLQTCLKDMLHIIENKCTKKNTNKTKFLTWQKVLKSFNARNDRERSLKELKQQWRTMKMDAKKNNLDLKESVNKPITLDDPLETNEDKIIEHKNITIIQESCSDDETPQQPTPVPWNKYKKIALASEHPSKRTKCRQENDMVLEAESTVDLNTISIRLMQAEHDLKMQHMTEAHTWAYEEHKLKCENLKLQNLLLQKQLSQ